MNIEYVKNKKYFSASSTHFYVGIVIFGIGAALFALSNIIYMGIIPYQTPIAVVLAIVGAIIAWVPKTAYSSEKDIEAQIAEATSPLVSLAEDKYGIMNGNFVGSGAGRSFNLALDQNPHYHTEKLSAYVYGAPESLYKRGADGFVRSSEYSAAALLFTEKKLFVYTRSLSLIENSMTDKASEHLLSDITGANISEEEITVQTIKGEATVKNTVLELSLSNSAPIRIFAQASSALDTLAEDFNHRAAGTARM